MEKEKCKKAEIQDIFALGLSSYLKKYPANRQQRKALFSIAHCRGPLMGRHVDKCDQCGHMEISYNSCRNRHCPKCQSSKQNQWVTKLGATLPRVRYFHLVFTLPHELNELVYKYQKYLYPVLFKASAQAVLQVASGCGFLGAQTGCLSVLHTWGQNLQYHPHIHMLVPGGGLSEDLIEWIPSGKKFFAPVKVLSRVFRSKFFSMLEDLVNRGTVKTDLSHLKARVYEKDWVVYSKKTFAGPGQVLSYLGKYTHRVAISNTRIIAFQEDKVIFWWKDYRDANRWKTMQLDVLEFIRRYMLHILPANFYKIRYYGIFALANRKQKLRQCIELIQQHLSNVPDKLIAKCEEQLSRICPVCQTGILKFMKLLPAGPGNG